MSTVYLVISHDDYSSSAVLGAYLSKASADAMVKACYDHLASRPMAMADPYNATDEECRAWNDAYEKWRKAHPFQRDTSDSYHAIEIEVQP